ncbi:hypothetical protein [Streptomyces marianii]|uniref:Uncharacterized protein n=1 Tax=Streptomyces marianii TaxID=1817406 RepID=A0A5R9EBE8_9ACTN|nr:hypothetical protein [Streptomyces marianii]TLQ46082.1 hypothetical protein FEF34_26565 [Streptomyces marianii]
MTNQIASLAARLAAVERRLDSTSRTARLAYSSIEDGAINVFDDDGSLRAVIGQQPDGTTGVNVVNGPPPPTPSQPTVTTVTGAVAATWEGTFADSIAAPLDFARVEVHAAGLDDFTPGTATLRGTFESPRGGTLTIPAEQPLYVRLLTRSSSGAASAPSAQSGPVAPGPIVAQEVLDGIVDETALAEGAVSRAKLQIGAVGHNQLAIGTGNLMPDPSFEGAFTEQLVAANSQWALVGGNGSPKALRVSGAGPAAASPSLLITELPVSPGNRFFLAVDYRVSADWVGNSVRFYLRWHDAAGAVLGYGTAIATPTPGADWARVSQQVQAPAGTVTATVWLQDFQASAGTADFDNAEIRTVVGAGMVLAESIGTLELAAQSVTGEKVVAKSLTAREVKALSLTGDEIATNTLTARNIAAGSLSASRLAIGTNGNLVGDPSYETGVIAAGLAASQDPAIFAVEDGGNNSAKRLRITPAPGAYRWVQHATSPVLPGDRYWIAADYKTTADFTGASVKLFLGFYDEAGTRLGSDGIIVSAPVTDGTWQRISQVITVPANTTQGNIRIGVDGTGSGTTTGSAYFDNLECRAVLSTPGSGARAEVSPEGLRLYDESGGEAISLTTGTPNYLTLTNNGTAVATIDQDGNTGVGDLSVAGKLSVGGDPIETYLQSFARGLVAVDYQVSTVTGGSTEYGYVELSFDADASRMYRVVLDCYAGPSAAGGELVVALRDGGAKTPSISSTQIQSVICPMPTAGYRRIHLETIRSGTSFGAGLHRLLTTFRCQNGPSGQTVRLFGGSTFPGVMYVEDVGPAVPETGVYNTGGGTTMPPKKTYVTTYNASWSGSYSSRGAYNSYYGNQCMQGYYSSNNGMQASLIGFPSSLGADLSGAVIQKAEIYIYFDHWYYNDGGKAVIKAHKFTARPATFSSDAESQAISWGKNVGKWVDITAVFDSTSWRGVALDPNNSDKTYYGRAHGVGQTYPPKLRVTYTK